MAARTPANTVTIQKINTAGPMASANVKSIQEDTILLNVTGGCTILKVLLQGQ